MEAILPCYLKQIQSPEYRKNGQSEREIIAQLALSVKTLVNNCEALTKSVKFYFFSVILLVFLEYVVNFYLFLEIIMDLKELLRNTKHLVSEITVRDHIHRLTITKTIPNISLTEVERE